MLTFLEHTLYLNRLASIIILGAGLFFIGCNSESKINVAELSPSITLSENNSRVIASGLMGLQLKENDLKKIFSVYVIEEGQNWKETDIQISGDYSFDSGLITFSPAYPLLESTQYYARLNLAQLTNSEVDELVTGHLFKITKDKTPVTFVEEVYPTTNLIPRNLLKFYIQFSGSMTEGQMLEHLRILDDKGEIVEHAFLEIPQELWVANRQRLTVLFDPGRIKRGMELLDEVGAPLKIGKEYTLQIDEAWKDGQQRPLTLGFEKTFTVVEDDRTKPEHANWTVSVPLVGTKEPLELHFNESMDYALLNRVITVLDNQDQPVTGEVDLVQGESVWKFTPDNFWKSESYTLHIKTILEDIAGNNLNAVFDIDLTDEEESVDRKNVKDFIEIPFEVRSK